MLSELRIKNFAIIDHITLRFNQGLTTLTGETGAGKSIIIDAVEVVLGGRAESTMVRSESDFASVEAVFELTDRNYDEVQTILAREELQDDPHHIILGREIRPGGRNTARVNGRSVSVSLLRELGNYLIDVHGQSEHLSLLRVQYHLPLLDRFTYTDESLSVAHELVAYQKTHNQLMQVQEEIELLQKSEEDAARRRDMLSYQLEEINNARLQPGEDKTLQEERSMLANAENLAKYTQESLVALDEGTPEAEAATDTLGKVVRALSILSRLDPSQSALHKQAQSVFEDISDLTSSLRNYLERIEFNPKRLNQVEERLALIDNLKRKFGDTIPEILEYASQSQEELDNIAHSEERLEELSSRDKQLRTRLGEEGWSLSIKRTAAAQSLSSGVEAELSELRMSGAGFKVSLVQEEDPDGIPVPGNKRLSFGPSGLERVEFLIAPNPGEGYKPLAKIASGGETSRLMLALKNVLTQADRIPTLIFDEIDQGIGGRVGAVVGEKLWSLARKHQVFCITHLPQLAAFGDNHFQVQKHIESGRTTTLVRSLHSEERLVELAQMMGEVSEGTLHSARELSQLAEQKTKTLK